MAVPPARVAAAPSASIALVPLFLSSGSELLRALAPELERAFRVPVCIGRPVIDVETAFDPARAQYNSRMLLALLLQDPAADTHRVLGVTSVDLFIPVLTHVFGEAQLAGRVAVVSTHRLDNVAYGLPADELLTAERLRKESIHELGHTFGLVHCGNDRCVMRASTYVEDIDLKSQRFCRGCAGELRAGARARASGRDGRGGAA